MTTAPTSTASETARPMGRAQARNGGTSQSTTAAMSGTTIRIVSQGRVCIDVTLYLGPEPQPRTTTTATRAITTPTSTIAA